MKNLITYTEDFHVLKHWKQLDGYQLNPCDDLNLLKQQNHESNAIILFHLNENEEQLSEIIKLVEQGFYIVTFSNTPSSKEGIKLFALGIKGYLNTFSTIIILKQVIEVVDSGNIWLGQLILNAMIVNIPQNKTSNQEWQQLLSKRELEAAKEILQGKNNREIAETLYISERTVKSYVSKLFKKLNARDRLDLVLKIQNWGVEKL